MGSGGFDEGGPAAAEDEDEEEEEEEEPPTPPPALLLAPPEEEEEFELLLALLFDGAAEYEPPPAAHTLAAFPRPPNSPPPAPTPPKLGLPPDAQDGGEDNMLGATFTGARLEAVAAEEDEAGANGCDGRPARPVEAERPLWPADAAEAALLLLPPTELRGPPVEREVAASVGVRALVPKPDPGGCRKTANSLTSSFTNFISL